MAQDRNRFGQCVWKDTELGHCVHSMQCLSFREVGNTVEPGGTSGHGAGGVLLSLADGIFFFDQERHDMRVDLGDDKVIDVEKLR